MNKNLIMLLIASALMGCSFRSTAYNDYTNRAIAQCSEFEYLESRTIAHINKIREQNGLKPLKIWSELTLCAREHSQNMADKVVPLGHIGFHDRGMSLQGGERFMDSFGENVAFNYNYANPVETAVEGWMESPGHRNNLLGEYEETGVGIARNAEGEWYLTQLFARRWN